MVASISGYVIDTVDRHHQRAIPDTKLQSAPKQVTCAKHRILNRASLKNRAEIMLVNCANGACGAGQDYFDAKHKPLRALLVRSRALGLAQETSTEARVGCSDRR